MNELKQLLAAREPVYRHADVVVHTSKKKPGGIVADLVGRPSVVSDRRRPVRAVLR